ncbi:MULTISPECIES: hypothetical protein [unclassified Methylobacterium]|uniref:hypothetical protein n=1 Tax=unclassified Methylobacterium TaxID=2615210 RepID=UPI0005BD5533|nr:MULTISPECIES: hypothetical protein [unclassified Methylobacterium]
MQLWASTHAFLENKKNARLTDPNAAAHIVWSRAIPAPVSYRAAVEMAAQFLDDPTASLSMERKVI